MSKGMVGACAVYVVVLLALVMWQRQKSIDVIDAGGRLSVVSGAAECPDVLPVDQSDDALPAVVEVTYR